MKIFNSPQAFKKHQEEQTFLHGMLKLVREVRDHGGERAAIVPHPQQDVEIIIRRITAGRAAGHKGLELQ